MSAWSFAIQLILVAVLVSFDDLISSPSCKISGEARTGDDDDLTVMLVADLMLKGPDASFADRFFRDHYISKFLTKSLEKVKPDMLLVLGDISAKGSELAASKWLTIPQQFQGLLGPFVGIPFHIALGDRDVGKCSKLDGKLVSQIASNLPGLDKTGCGAFEISNISFVSLNSAALLCGNNDLRFGVEKVIESEHLDILRQKEDGSEETSVAKERGADFNSLPWIVNDVAFGSGPVVLLHFPLYRMTRRELWEIDVPGDNPCEISRAIGDSVGPYDWMETLPPNATEYIFYSLKPRMIFSAHTHIFCDYSHLDGIREVTVPAMTWYGKEEPGFVVATFGQKKAVTVSHCSFAKESHVVMAYVVLIILLFITTLLARQAHTTSIVP